MRVWTLPFVNLFYLSYEANAIPVVINTLCPQLVSAGLVIPSVPSLRSGDTGYFSILYFSQCSTEQDPTTFLWVNAVNERANGLQLGTQRLRVNLTVVDFSTTSGLKDTDLAAFLAGNPSSFDVVLSTWSIAFSPLTRQAVENVARVVALFLISVRQHYTYA
jgi:hypothetical protein